MSRAIISSVCERSFFHPLWQQYYAPFFEHVETIPVPVLHDFGETTARQNRLLADLIQRHDVIMVVDIDEIVVPNPRHYANLGEYLDRLKHDITGCVGYNVIQMPWEPEYNLSKGITQQREYWQRCIQYDKPVITRKLISFSPGGHRCNGDAEQDADLIMFHLRDADIRRSFERRNLIDNMTSRQELMERISQAELIPAEWKVI